MVQRIQNASDRLRQIQQIGRAGRGVPRAEVVLLPGREDRDIWAYFASLAFPPEAVVRSTLAALADAGRPLSAGALETRVDLSRGRLETMLKVLDVDGAVCRVSGGWEPTGQPWSYDAERYATHALRYGFVVDFIDWHIGDRYHWPTFNIADSGIVVGVFVLLWISYWLDRKVEEEKPEPSPVAK